MLAQVVGAQVQLLATLLATIADLDQAIGNRLATHPKAQLLARLPRVGQLSHAQLLAELSPILDRTSSARARRGRGRCQPGHQGVRQEQQRPLSPGRQSAGTPSPARLRRQRPPQLPMGGRLYANARARGKRHPQAVRVLGRAWLRVIWACWHINTAYAPAKHRAEQRLAA